MLHQILSECVYFIKEGIIRISNNVIIEYTIEIKLWKGTSLWNSSAGCTSGGICDPVTLTQRRNPVGVSVLDWSPANTYGNTSYRQMFRLFLYLPSITEHHRALQGTTEHYRAPPSTTEPHLKFVTVCHLLSLTSTWRSKSLCLVKQPVFVIYVHSFRSGVITIVPLVNLVRKDVG